MALSCHNLSEDSAHLFSMMMQDVQYLFEETIQFNIALVRSIFTRVEVEQAARYVVR